MIKLSDQTKGALAIVVMTFAFATMAVFARFLNEANFSLFEQVYLRLAIAFVVGGFIFRKDIRIKKYLTLNKKDTLILIFRALSMYLGVVLFTEAVIHTKLANASVVAFFPLLPFLAYIFLKESLGIKKILFILLSFIGVVLIALQDIRFTGVGYGEICAFMSMVLFDFSYMATRWQSNYLNNKETTLAMFFIASVSLFVVSILIGEIHQDLFSFNTASLVILILSGVTNIITLLLTNYGLQKVNFSLSKIFKSLKVVW
jgi:drug/metabolite transporter (DMT)-like permease